MKVICPICEKIVSAYIPKGGDGSAYRPYRHGDCEGRFELVTEIYEEGNRRGYALARKNREAKEKKLIEVINSL
jgi:hypothetical protein